MLDLLLKQFGFNPADLKKQVEDAAQNFNKVVQYFQSRFDNTDAKIDRLEKLIIGLENVRAAHSVIPDDYLHNPIRGDIRND